MSTAVTTQQQQRTAELNVLVRKQRSLWRDAFYRLLRNRAAIVGMVVILTGIVLTNVRARKPKQVTEKEPAAA